MNFEQCKGRGMVFQPYIVYIVWVYITDSAWNDNFWLFWYLLKHEAHECWTIFSTMDYHTS